MPRPIIFTTKLVTTLWTTDQTLLSAAVLGYKSSNFRTNVNFPITKW